MRGASHRIAVAHRSAKTFITRQCSAGLSASRYPLSRFGGASPSHHLGSWSLWSAVGSVRAALPLMPTLGPDPGPDPALAPCPAPVLAPALELPPSLAPPPVLAPARCCHNLEPRCRSLEPRCRSPGVDLGQRRPVPVHTPSSGCSLGLHPALERLG